MILLISYYVNAMVRLKLRKRIHDSDKRYYLKFNYDKSLHSENESWRK